MFSVNEDHWKKYTKPVTNTGPGLTKQSEKDRTDVHLIVRKYQKTGVVDFLAKHEPKFMDVNQLEFQEAMNIIVASEAMFQDMPSNLRKRFNNDPGDFLAFVQNPDNIEECYDLGLANRPDPEPGVSPPPLAGEPPLPVEPA